MKEGIQKKRLNCNTRLLTFANHNSYNTTHLIEHCQRLGELRIPQERCQEFEEISQQHGVHGPSLLLRGDGQHAANEDTVTHNLQPGIGKPWTLAGAKQMQCLGEGHQNLERRILSMHFVPWWDPAFISFPTEYQVV